MPYHPRPRCKPCEKLVLKPADLKYIAALKAKIVRKLKESRKPVRARELRRKCTVRGGYENRMFDTAIAELKSEGKIVVRPVMSTEYYGRKTTRFDKQLRRFSSEPWVCDYEYIYCESLLDSLAQVSE